MYLSLYVQIFCECKMRNTLPPLHPPFFFKSTEERKGFFVMQSVVGETSAPVFMPMRPVLNSFFTQFSHVSKVDAPSWGDKMTFPSPYWSSLAFHFGLHMGHILLLPSTQAVKDLAQSLPSRNSSGLTFVNTHSHGSTMKLIIYAASSGRSVLQTKGSQVRPRFISSADNRVKACFTLVLLSI